MWLPGTERREGRVLLEEKRHDKGTCGRASGRTKGREDRSRARRLVPISQVSVIVRVTLPPGGLDSILQILRAAQSHPWLKTESHENT